MSNKKTKSNSKTLDAQTKNEIIKEVTKRVSYKMFWTIVYIVAVFCYLYGGLYLGDMLNMLHVRMSTSMFMLGIWSISTIISLAFFGSIMGGD